MKIVFICSSYREHGNTERILLLLENSLLRLADRNGVRLETELIPLGREKIRPCHGCRLCFDRGEEYCPLKDDSMPLIQGKMRQADAVVAAGPVYVEDVNGIMKNWIDRLAFFCHRPAFYGKCAAVLSTSAAGSSNHAVITMANALNAWGFRVVAKEKFRMGALMEPEQTAALFENRADKIAAVLFRSIVEQSALKPSFPSRAAFSIRQAYYRKAEAGTKDYLYWKNNGWLEKTAVYFAGRRPNRMKTSCARLIGFLVAKLILT